MTNEVTSICNRCNYAYPVDCTCLPGRGAKRRVDAEERRRQQLEAAAHRFGNRGPGRPRKEAA